MISFRQTIPHLRKVRVLPLQGCLYGFCRTIHILRKFCDVAAGGVNENQVWLKSFQLWVFKHSILPITGIFRLIKRRLNPIVQQEQFQHGNNIICGRTAQNCNLFSMRGVPSASRAFLIFLRFFRIHALSMVLVILS